MCNQSIMNDQSVGAIISHACSLTKKVTDSKVPTLVLDELVNDKFIKQVHIIVKLNMVA